jgi:hypothetical protein
MRICFTLHFMGKGHEDMRETWRGEAGTTFSEVAGSHQQALTTGYVHLAVLTSPVLYVWFCVECCMASECVPGWPASRHDSIHETAHEKRAGRWTFVTTGTHSTPYIEDSRFA